MTNHYDALAYGWVAAGANPLSATPNIISCTFDEKLHRYEITIKDEPYVWQKYVTLVQPEGQCFAVPSPSEDGKLTVSLFNAQGQPVQANFQFVTYKI
jgi:hypothetical protein